MVFLKSGEGRVWLVNCPGGRFTWWETAFDLFIMCAILSKIPDECLTAFKTPDLSLIATGPPDNFKIPTETLD